jgi:hypothetical protein
LEEPGEREREPCGRAWTSSEHRGGSMHRGGPSGGLLMSGSLAPSPPFPCELMV